MRIASSQQGDITVLEVAGELTADSAARFTQTVTEAFRQGHRDFLVNLQNVGTIDSVGLEAFTALQRWCEEQLGIVRFCGPDPMVRKIFELTRLDRTLTIHETVEEALASFA